MAARCRTASRFATILRFYTDAGDGDPEGQVLVITRLGGPGQVCHIGYVDARVNPDANAIAREVADNGAADFDCGRDQPAAIRAGRHGGERGVAGALLNVGQRQTARMPATRRSDERPGRKRSVTAARPSR